MKTRKAKHFEGINVHKRIKQHICFENFWKMHCKKIQKNLTGVKENSLFRRVKSQMSMYSVPKYILVFVLNDSRKYI